MVGLTQADFAPTLVRRMGDYLGRERMPVMACGMVGAKQGWAEAAYAAVPCAPPGIDQATRVQDAAFDLAILPGVKQDTPAEVMRGEETQIAGYLAQDPNFDGVLCLPGTHTKWVHISAGEIVSFRTARTGELYALLSTQSILRHGVGEGWDEEVFAEAMSSTLSKPETLAMTLFNIRAEGLLHGLSPPAATARLSGLLIGAALAALRPYWLGQRVVILGAEVLSKRYAAALQAQAVPAEMVGAEALTLAGLIAAQAHRKAAA